MVLSCVHATFKLSISSVVKSVARRCSEEKVQTMHLLEAWMNFSYDFFQRKPSNTLEFSKRVVSSFPLCMCTPSRYPSIAFLGRKLSFGAVKYSFEWYGMSGCPHCHDHLDYFLLSTNLTKILEPLGLWYLTNGLL